MAEDIDFSDILRNPHFSQFTALLSVPYGSMHWRQRHPEVPFWTRVKTITKLMHDGGIAHKNLRNQFINEFTTLIVELVSADPKLFYRTEDMDWFVQTLSGEYATLTMSMLFAAASSRQTYLTPAQIAEITGTSESNWRNKAAAGEIIGAVKAGKQWLVPKMSLQAYGTAVDIPGQVIEEEEMIDPATESSSNGVAQ
jgi:Helix-turn-helix domain